MIIPIRCFSCNKLIAHQWELYLQYMKEGCSEAEALEKLNVHRLCCRRMFLSQI